MEDVFTKKYKALNDSLTAGHITDDTYSYLLEKMLLDKDEKAERKSMLSPEDDFSFTDLQTFPWKKDFINYTRLSDNLFDPTITTDEAIKSSEKYLEYRKESYITSARAGRLSFEEVIQGAYAFFPLNPVLRLQTVIFFTMETPEAERIKTHNWRMLAQMNKVERERWGPYISSLLVPLFRPRVLQDLNSQIMKIASASINDAGNLYLFQKLFRLQKTISGAGYDPIINEHGQQVLALDTTSLENKMNGLYQAINTLKHNTRAPLERHYGTAPRRTNAKVPTHSSHQRKFIGGSEPSSNTVVPSKNVPSQME